jgi:hypothetical protein
MEISPNVTQMVPKQTLWTKYQDQKGGGKTLRSTAGRKGGGGTPLIYTGTPPQTPGPPLHRGHLLRRSRWPASLATHCTRCACAPRCSRQPIAPAAAGNPLHPLQPATHCTRCACADPERPALQPATRPSSPPAPLVARAGTTGKLMKRREDCTCGPVAYPRLLYPSSFPIDDRATPVIFGFASSSLARLCCAPLLFAAFLFEDHNALPESPILGASRSFSRAAAPRGALSIIGLSSRAQVLSLCAQEARTYAPGGRYELQREYHLIC